MPASAEAAPLPALVEQLTEAGKALHRRGLKLLDGDAEWVGCSHFIETGDLLLAAAAALRVAASAGRGEQECAE